MVGLVIVVVAGLTALYWWLPAQGARRAGLLGGTVLLAIMLTALLTPQDREPHQRLIVALGLVALEAILIGFVVWSINRPGVLVASIGVVLLSSLFVLSKWPEAWSAVFAPLAVPSGAWLGLSFILFRLLHLMFDRRRGQLQPVRFADVLIYVLFPPSLIAGPIDRFPRFKSDLDRVGRPFRSTFVSEGLWRILSGAVKKFVIADSLAKLPLEVTAYPDQTPTVFLWLALYAYGFLLYFDFSGYTDMALGVARLIGFRLPENFDAPYLKTNLARFWQSWHITLSFWARDYVFLPLARTLRLKVEWLPANIVAVTCHLATMLVIGLWHGFAWTFVAWGVWHAAGLFIVKLWGDYRRPRTARRAPHHRSGWRLFPGWFITFNYVMLGWVFFSASDLPSAFATLGRLFGVTP